MIIIYIAIIALVGLVFALCMFALASRSDQSMRDFPKPNNSTTNNQPTTRP